MASARLTAPDRPPPPVGQPPTWVALAGARAATPDERQLRAAVERIARAGPGASPGWSAVALHLSRLRAPGPRAHHRRVALALLQDAGRRADGQVFTLRNGDTVLLARGDAEPAATLSERLRLLFAPDAGDTGPVVSVWALPDGCDDLLAYAAARLAEPAARLETDPAGPPPVLIDAVATAIVGVRPHDLIQRQTAIHLDPANGAAGGTMRVSYRELTISLAVLESRLPGTLRLEDDLALLSHLGRCLDQRMLDVLAAESGGGTPLDIGGAAGATAHLNLSVPSVLSDAFSNLAARCLEAGAGLGVEVSMVEAVADPAAFARAGVRLRRSGARLVLDGVSHLAMLLARPWTLPADLLKLDWTPRMAELPEAERRALDAAVAEADPARIVLHRAESEAAVRWGLARGIRLFQGRQIDQMLAVRRMLRCPDAADCTPRHCAEREIATGGAGRAACTNLRLLDAGLPGANDVVGRRCARRRPGPDAARRRTPRRDRTRIGSRRSRATARPPASRGVACCCGCPACRRTCASRIICGWRVTRSTHCWGPTGPRGSSCPTTTSPSSGAAWRRHRCRKAGRQ